MNNVIDRNYNSNTGRENNIYNVSLGERLIAFFCLVIAFFEDRIVNTVCRLIGGAVVMVASVFYASALMAGSLSLTEIVIYGLLLIAASALTFRVNPVSRS